MAIAIVPPTLVHASAPQISISDVRVIEGDAGARRAEFTITATGPICEPIRVDYAIHDGSATAADGDFVPATGTATLQLAPPIYVGEWGGGEFGQVQSITVGSDGNVYVADRGYGIWRRSPDGHPLFGWPVSNPLLVEAHGDELLVVREDRRVDRYSLDGVLLGSFGVTANTHPWFTGPNDITVAPDGSFFVMDDGYVKHFDPSGTFLDQWRAFERETSLEFNQAGELLTAGDGGGFGTGWSTYVHSNTPDGSFIRRWSAESTAGALRWLAKFERDDCGRLWFMDFDRLLVTTEDGQFLTEFPGIGLPYSGPRALAIDDQGGNFYTVENRYMDPVFEGRVHHYLVRATATVSVDIGGDERHEGSESFTVELSAPVNGEIADGVGSATIDDDDSDVGALLNSNPSFATGLAGWVGSDGGTAQWVSTGRTDGGAVHVLGAPVVQPFGINDSPDFVQNLPNNGQRYRFTAWVRGLSGGGSIRLRAREYAGNVYQGTTNSPSVALDGTWQRVVLTVVALNAGDHLDLQVLNDPAEPLAEFLIDDVSVQPIASDTPPHLTVESERAAPWNADVVIPIIARDPDGEPVAVELDRSALPAGNDARIEPGAHAGEYTFRWEPGMAAVRPEPYVVGLTARNGLTASAQIQITATANLVANPGFESGTQGWFGNQGATLSQVTPGRASGHALRVVNTAGSPNFGITDSPDWARAGATHMGYLGSVWARSNAEGGRGWIVFREYQNGVLVGSTTSQQVILSEQWAYIQVDYYTERPNSTVDMVILMQPFGASQELLVDDASIEQISTPASVLAAPEPASATLAAAIRPNPAHSSGTLELTLHRDGPVRVTAYDVNGRLVRAVADHGRLAAGMHRFRLERGSGANRLAPGVYFCRIETAEGRITRRWVVLD